MTISLRYHPNLYLGESVSKQDINSIKRKLERKPLLANLYLITISNHTSDQLDVYASGQLIQRYYKKHVPLVIGIAGSHAEALLLVEDLVRDCFEKRGDCELKEFLKC